MLGKIKHTQFVNVIISGAHAMSERTTLPSKKTGEAGENQDKGPGLVSEEFNHESKLARGRIVRQPIWDEISIGFRLRSSGPDRCEPIFVSLRILHLNKQVPLRYRNFKESLSNIV